MLDSHLCGTAEIPLKCGRGLELLLFFFNIQFIFSFNKIIKMLTLFSFFDSSTLSVHNLGRAAAATAFLMSTRLY
jgi:hypothetical protein